MPLLRALVHLLFVPRRLVGRFLGHDGDGRGRAAGERGPKRKLLWHVGRSTHVSPVTRHHRDEQEAEHPGRVAGALGERNGARVLVAGDVFLQALSAVWSIPLRRVLWFISQ